MTINFVCPSCKKKVKAPVAASGKWGNCPHCNLKCYIPLPPAPEEEDLKLIPLEEGEEQRYEDQLKEVRELQVNILHETMGVKNDTDYSFNEQDEKQLWRNILTYLRQMADGELDNAEQTVGNIVRHGKHAKKILAKIASSKKPEPELADIAGVVLKGLMKNLVSEIDGE